RTKTPSIATTAAAADGAPVHVSSSFPSLPRTRETVPLTAFGTQTSAPSQAGKTGFIPTTVPPAFPSTRVQKRSAIARGLERRSAVSTVRERKAAICRRVTLPEGSYVVGVVPVVIPSVKISSTKGQKASAAVSAKGPQRPASDVPAPSPTAATAAIKDPGGRRRILMGPSYGFASNHPLRTSGARGRP